MGSNNYIYMEKMVEGLDAKQISNGALFPFKKGIVLCHKFSALNIIF